MDGNTGRPDSRNPRWPLALLTLLVLAAHGLALWLWLGQPAATVAPPTDTLARTRVQVNASVPATAPTDTTAAPATAVTATPPQAAAMPGNPPGTATPAGQADRQNSEQNKPSALASKGFSATESAVNQATQQAAATTATPAQAASPTTPKASGGTSTTGQGQTAPLPEATNPAPTPAEPAQAQPTAQAAPAVAVGGAASTPPHVPAPTVARRLVVPGSTQLEFSVQASRKGLNLPAQSTLVWQTDGGSYRASLVIRAALGLGRDRNQTSVGTIDPVLGLQPQRFGDKNKTEVATHFDRSRTPPAIRFSSNAPETELLPGSQDRLSVLLQLAAMLAGEPRRYVPGSVVLIHTAGSRDAELWHFKVGTVEPLELPAGSLNALHLVREPLHAYDNRVEVWLAPALGHLPVRILWTQANGDVVDQRLASHTP